MFKVKYSGTTVTFIFLVCFALAAQTVQAVPISSYTLSPSSGTFTPLSGATVQTLASGNTDDGIYPLAPIGFNFTYEDTVYTQVSAVTNGWMTFGNLATTNDLNNNLSAGGARPLVAPLWDDLEVSPTGSVSYLTTGTAPNRIFTMQWLNMEWFYNVDTPSISFQVKLYETTNTVEFIYRQEAGVTATGRTASIGLAGIGTGSGNFLSLNSSGTNPTASSMTETTNISAKPATGQIYTFTPGVVTAANVSVSGRVLTPDGRGLRNAMLLMIDSNGTTRSSRTTTFGYFRFNDVEVGETYIFQVQSKQFSFAPQVISINEDLTELNFTAQKGLN